jgi:hypothetical protein
MRIKAHLFAGPPSRQAPFRILAKAVGYRCGSCAAGEALPCTKIHRF